jgi:hypothetical protein
LGGRELKGLTNLFEQGIQLSLRSIECDCWLRHNRVPR